jgi:NHL repeat
MSKSKFKNADRAGAALVAAGLLATGLSLVGTGVTHAQGLPAFTGLNDPEGIAVDAGGDVFIADAGNN